MSIDSFSPYVYGKAPCNIVTDPQIIDSALIHKTPGKYKPKADETIFVFIRHGENLSNVNRTYDGRTLNLPLTGKGHDQGRETGKFLATRVDHIDNVIVNAMVRTQETAERVLESFPESSPEFSLTSGFMERYAGRFEGDLLKNIEFTNSQDKKTSADPTLSFEEKMNFSPMPGEMESYGEIWRRVYHTLQNTASELKGRVVVAVTHSGIMRSIFWHLMQELNVFVPYENFKPNNGASIYVSVKNGNITLLETYDFEFIPSKDAASSSQTS